MIFIYIVSIQPLQSAIDFTMRVYGSSKVLVSSDVIETIKMERDYESIKSM